MFRLILLRTSIVFCFIWGGGPSQKLAIGAEVLFPGEVGGVVSIHTITADDSLVELARYYDVGYNEITIANPGVDPFIPKIGIRALIPGQFILPDVLLRSGIIINLSEMRLYYFHPRTRELVDTFPVGIGDKGWETPGGKYRIIEKIANPAWYVPASIRKQKPELPKIVPPGPDNPLGTHALRLSIGTVLIHGTNRPFGIGRRVSHGCIHLYPEDIVRLFKEVSVGTRVVIVRQPVKVALADDRVLVEIHADGSKDLKKKAVNLLKGKGLLNRVDLGRLDAALRVKSGIPTDITKNK